MDKTLADTLTANLKSAKTPEAKLDALVLASIAQTDCQRKTSERVKWLVKAFWALAAVVVIIVTCGPEAAHKFLVFWK